MSSFSPKRLPQELWDMVVNHFSYHSAVDASRVFHFGLQGKQRKFAELWHSIFKNDTWRSIAEKANLSPVLIGRDLKNYTQNSKEGSYLILCVGDRDSNIQCERKAFFKSLQPHKYYEKTGEVQFDSDLLLNVAEVIDRPKIIPAD